MYQQLIDDGNLELVVPESCSDNLQEESLFVKGIFK